MSPPERFGLEADLELFRSSELGTRRSRQRAVSSAHWELGFGPAGDTHPVWGLYQFERAARLLSRRELL